MGFVATSASASIVTRLLTTASIHQASQTGWHFCPVKWRILALHSPIVSDSSGSHRTSLVRLRREGRSIRCQAQEVIANVEESQAKEMVATIEERLSKEFPELPTGEGGRDDKELLLWFLRDRRFDIEKATAKLAAAIKWREEFGVQQLTKESVAEEAATGKAYLLKEPDRMGRPVIIVAAAKHYPDKDRLLASQQLCVYMIEQALIKLKPGQEQILGIFDLRGFKLKNGDPAFVKFLIEAFFNYYPKRLGEVLFVDAPMIFQPGWSLMKPLLKSYSSLVRFCSADVVRNEYFTPETVPDAFKEI